jgi:hypothetical protein
MDSSAASMAKSHLDFRPKPPPSSLGHSVISVGVMLSAAAMWSRAWPGLCTGDEQLSRALPREHGFHLPPHLHRLRRRIEHHVRIP